MCWRWWHALHEDGDMLIDLLIASDEDGEDVDIFMAIKDLLIASVIGRRKIFSHRPHLFCERRFRTQKVVVQQSEYPAAAALLTTAERSRPWGSEAAPASLPPPSLLPVSMTLAASFCISSLKSLLCLSLERNAMRKATGWLLYRAILLDWRWRRLIGKSRTQIAWLRRLIGLFWKLRRSLIG